MTKNPVKLSENLSTPLTFVTEKLAWIGVTGSGKSFGAQRSAEQLWKAGAPFVALDPKGDWWGLRLAADGKSPGLPIPVFGGLHGDVPLETGGGALVADTIFDKQISCVVDVSQFDTDADMHRFVTAFLDRLFVRHKRTPTARHLYLEECQEILPQNPQPGEQRMIHVAQRVQKMGRGVGLGTSLITPRPQEVSKKALNQAQTVFMFRLTGSHERKAMTAWVIDNEMEEDVIDQLPKLPTGTCHVWSPAWLRTFATAKISPKETFNSGATPEVGAKLVVRELADIDLAALKTAMAATIEQAKANDPAELKKELARLKAELAKKPVPKAAPEVKVETVEVPALKGGEINRLEKLVERAEKHLEKVSAAVKEGQDLSDRIFEILARGKANGQPAVRIVPAIPPRPVTRMPMIEAPARQAKTPVFSSEKGDEALGRGERAVLTAVIQHGAMGGCTREQLSVLTGYKRASRNTYLQRLGAAGYVTQQGERVIATPAGESALGDVAPLPTGAALQDHWLNQLSGGEKAVFEIVVQRYPQAVDREEISNLTNYARASRNTYIQRLGARQLVVSVGGGVKASDHLF